MLRRIQSCLMIYLDKLDSANQQAGFEIMPIFCDICPSLEQTSKSAQGI